MGWGLNSRITFFFRANTDGLFHVGDKYLAVADLAGFRRFDDGTNGRIHLGVGDHEFDFDLGQEIDRIFTATIDFGVTFLAAEAFDFGHGHTFDADLGEGFLNFLELERLDDGDDEFHLIWNLGVVAGH